MVGVAKFNSALVTILRATGVICPEKSRAVQLSTQRLRRRGADKPCAGHGAGSLRRFHA
jgi:hypothetical protein